MSLSHVVMMITSRLSFFCRSKHTGSAQVLRVLANIAHKNPESCVRLAQRGLLPALCATLKMADQEMVTLSLDVLSMLLVGGSQVN